MPDDKKPTDWRDKVKSPSEKSERMIGGKNSLPQNEGKTDYKQIQQEGPKKGGWQGRSGRGGGGPIPIQKMINRKGALPPVGPLSKDESEQPFRERNFMKDEIIQPEPNQLVDLQPDEKKSIMLAMKSIEPERPSFLNEIQAEKGEISFDEPSQDEASFDGGDGGDGD